MQKKFGEWYRMVCLQPSSEQLKNRWESIQGICDINSKTDVLELTKLYFNLQVSIDFKDEFINTFIDNDVSFEATNQQEISFLAGFILIKLINEDKYADIILLAIMSLSLFKSDNNMPEILDYFLEKFEEITSMSREMDLTINSIGEIDISSFKSSITVANNTQTSFSVLSNILTNILEGIYIFRDNEEKLLNTMNIYREDSNILAWLFGGTSNYLKIPLNKKIPQNKAALILAKELADMIKNTPGPFAAKAYLKKMLSYCKDDNQTTLVGLVDNTDLCWKKELILDYDIIDKDGLSTPILLAIKKSLEVDQPGIWKYSYNKLVGLDAEQYKSDSLTWAYQLYLECILIKSFNSEEENG